MNKQKGFTLIELLVTIIIMGIMAAVALPAMTGFMERHMLKSLSTNYTNAFVFARNEAIRQNVSVMVCGARINYSGQLVGCANNTYSWRQGVFVYADVDGNRTYNSATDSNIRVVNSPNVGANTNKVTIGMSLSPLSGGTSTVTNPHVEFLPNGQVRVAGIANANYLVMTFTGPNHSVRSLMGPTGQIIHCNKNIKASNTGNQVAQLCANY